MIRLKRKKHSHSLLVPGVEEELKNAKNEIAEEFGVSENINQKSHQNEQTRGKMTERLIENAEEQKRARARK